MSDEAVDGAMIIIDEAMFFIPRDDLRAFRLPDAAAADARAQVEDQAPEVAGFQALPDTGTVIGVRFQVGGILGMSSLMAHAITVKR
jgi:hypothetical protein